MAKSTKKVDALSMFESSVPAKAAPRQKTPAPKSVPEKHEEVKEIKETKVKEEPAKTDENPVPGIQLMKSRKEKETRKNKSRTFYMSDALYEKLRSLAKENECSASEYLTFLLEQILYT